MLFFNFKKYIVFIVKELFLIYEAVLNVRKESTVTGSYFSFTSDIEYITIILSCKDRKLSDHQLYLLPVRKNK